VEQCTAAMPLEENGGFTLTDCEPRIERNRYEVRR
jgi:hypothetical protein